MVAEAFYDNTTNNPDNPSNPPKDVSLGEATTDEMMLVYFSYMAYKAGDENISLDTLFYKTGGNYMIDIDSRKVISCVPNPSHGQTTLNITSDIDEKVNIYVYDMQGRRVELPNQTVRLLPTNNNIQLSLEHLTKGNYLIRVIGEKTNLTTQFVRE
ncbi:MAG: T9SS type A sorting domain-containing protein [Bacteroidetes bacterium]|nr:T9SS type A sorting domain-containing protein [Bacteroidota bacterium]